MNKLSASPQFFGIDELADMLEETGWFESDFQAAFGELESEGRVKNLDAPRRRRTTYVHFDAQGNRGERLSKEQP